MNAWLLSFFACVTILASAPGQDGTNSTHRVSIAEVGAVRLAVEQPLHKNELRVRVRDFAARNWQKQNVSCDVYSVGDDGKEDKITSIKLSQVSPTADDYSGACGDLVEFEHGNVVRVVYKSDGLRLPISTWYAFYYH